VTVLHDELPRLIDAGRRPALTTLFYGAGGTAALVTTAALVMAWVRGVERRAIHLWIGVAMAAFCADILASLGAYERYTLGWYFGRILAIFAASVLLFVFLGEIINLYRSLGETVLGLAKSNRSLVSLVKQHQRCQIGTGGEKQATGAADGHGLSHQNA
jgi:hypothetical protein